ncbi:MAG: VWA domain-containing protein [Acidobacteriota bacterium]
MDARDLLSRAPLTFERPWLLLALPIGVAIVFLLTRRSRSDLEGSRRLVALAARLVVVLLLALALAGTTINRHNPALSVVFALDESRSLSPEERERGRQFVRDALRKLDGNDRAGVVLFGADAVLERLPAGRKDGGRDAPAFDAHPDGNGSDIGRAIELSAAVMPANTERRVVLLSDGIENAGSALEAAQVARAGDVDIQVVPLGGTRKGGDVFVDSLQVPPSVKEGETFEVRIVLRAVGGGSEPRKTLLRLFRDQTFLGEQEVGVEPSKISVFRALQTLSAGGFYRYRVEIVPRDAAVNDAIPENDFGHGFVQVEGRPRILLVEGAPGEGDAIRSVLASSDVDVTAIPSMALPVGLDGLAAYQSIILCNVSALDLSQKQGENLRTYVKEIGGGLVMTGGESSFGPGGYYKTPVEEALPVDMDVKNRQYFPAIAMALVIDKSGSMGEMGDRYSKLSMAREAASLTAELLTKQDEMMVVAFDSAAQIVVPLHKVTSKDRIVADIGTIRTGGGTDIYPGLDAAYQSLATSKAAMKHVILISDGMSSPGDYEGLAAKMKAKRITLSTVAIGEDADLMTMEKLAKLGDGKFYSVNDIKNIPKIFTKETIVASRSYLIEEPFRPRPSRSSDVLKGIDLASVPNLYGYVATSPKDRAEILLKTHKDDPLLAIWRYGLGKSAAFTSDEKPRWARDWLGWDGNGKLWTQLARWTVSTTGPGEMHVATDVGGGKVTIDADVLDELGARQNFLDVRARLVGPDGEASDVALPQVGPGRYRGQGPATAAGTYFVAVTAARDGQERNRRITGAALSFPEEFRRFGRDMGLLTDVAAATGGALASDAGAVFRHDLTRHPIRTPIWPQLAAAALLLFLIDVAIRRVMLPDAFYDWLLSPLRALKALTAAAQAPSHISRLKARKQAVWNKPAAEKAGGAKPAAPNRIASLPDAPEEGVVAQVKTVAVEEPEEPTRPAGFSDRLLDAKRRAKK